MASYPPYSDTFISARYTTTGFTDYTVPAGKVAVIDSITIVQDVGNAASYSAVSVDPTGSGSFVLIWAANIAAGPNANARSGSQWTGRVVVRAGGKIRTQTLAATGAYMTVSGFLLRQVP